MMTRSDWLAVADALRVLRASVRLELDDDVAVAAHARKLIYFATLSAIDRVARELADVFECHACSFERKRFLRIIALPRS
jgi:hypothetical protein